MINYKDYELKETSRKKESTEWSITYSYNTEDKTLPRILLIGDSICHGYHSNVHNKLLGKCLVTHWATSKCVTDPSYFRELNYILDGYTFDYVSFNNGLHSFDSDRKEWETAYRSAVKFIQDKIPGVKLFLTLSTPLQIPELTAISMELNATVKKVAKEKELAVIDLFTAMDKRDRNTDWSDSHHFKSAAVDEQAEIIANAVIEELNKK